MLKQIYNFAIDNQLSGESCWREKYVRYHVLLDNDGNFIDIEENKNKKLKVVCPSYPDRKLYGSTANFLIDKGSVIFDTTNKKNASYLEDIKAAAVISDEIKIVNLFLNQINDSNLYDQFSDDIKNKLDTLKGTADLVSFKLNGIYLESSDSWKEYFLEKYNLFVQEELAKEKDNDNMISVVSGKVISPIKNTDKVMVAGVTSSTGDVLICCDKDSFSSYGLEKALNGAISKEESEALKLGLEYLLSNNYNRDWNLIHWYKDSDSIDLIDAAIDSRNFWLDDLETIDDYDKKTTEEKDQVLYKFLKDLLEKGKLIQNSNGLESNEYYLLRFKPCSGRIAFSDFKIGNFSELIDNLTIFYEDSKLLTCWWIKENDKSILKTDSLPIVNIYSILLNLLNSNVDGNKRFEQVSKEFSIYKKNKLLDAILNNKQIPYDFVIRAVNVIKRDKVSGKKTHSSVYKILKVYINRDSRIKGDENFIMSGLNKENKNIAYNLGRLLCVYEKIQETALGNRNASIVDKYYSSASTSPGYVFGKLNSLSNYHLRKIDNPGKVIYYKRLIQEIMANIDSIPKRLDITDQANFGLGYYQQEQSFYVKNNENIKEDNNNVE